MLTDQARAILEQKISELERKVIAQIKTHFPDGKADGEARYAEISNIHAVRPARLFDLGYERELKSRHGSLLGQIVATIVIKDKATNKVIGKPAEVTMVEIPYPTERGTLIIKGNEKVIWNLLRLRPGIYSENKSNKIHTSVMLQRGNKANASIEFVPGTANLTIDFPLSGHKGSLNPIAVLRVLGSTEAEIEYALKDDKLSQNVIKKGFALNISETVGKLFKAFYENKKRPTDDEETTEMIRKYLSEKTQFSERGQESLSITMHRTDASLSAGLLLDAIKRTLDIAKGKEPDDFKDDMRFQQVIDGDTAIVEKVEKGLLDFVNQKLLKNLKSDKKSGASVVFPSNAINKPLEKFLRTGTTVDFTEQINPLHLLESGRKITKLGDSGLTESNVQMTTRNLQASAFNKIDPVETPESSKIGLNAPISKSAVIADGSIYAPVLIVKNGKAVDSDANVKMIEPRDEYKYYIAFNDPHDIARKNGAFLLPDTVRVRHAGGFESVPSSQVDYIDRSPHDIFGYAANLIPFIAHSDANRMLMGTNHLRQAITLVDRETPLVQNAVDPEKTKTYEEVVGNEHSFPIRSLANGTITAINDDAIVVKGVDGKEHGHDRYSYFPLNQNNFINNELVEGLKVGDKVKKDQLLAEGWQTKGGTLALGKNVKIAYMPWKGYNFEDGVVVSKSLTNRMISEEVKVQEVEITDEMVGGTGSRAKSMLRQTASRADLSSLDDDGIIKMGSAVRNGDIIVGALKKVVRKPGEGAFLDSLMGHEDFRDFSFKVEGFTHGKVINVEVLSGEESGEPGVKQMIKVSILMQSKLKVGDKVSGRHGNKGIITKIEDDADMPQIPGGGHVELIYSPLAVPSRKNLGQLLETHAGLIAERTGKPYAVYNFDKSEKDKVMAGLKAIGVPDGKIKLINPATGKTFDRPTTVGNMYILKLKHKVDDKIQSRHFGKEDATYLSPTKASGVAAGEKGNPQRIGEMEMTALQANKAIHNILEATTIKSDGAGGMEGRADIFEAIAKGKALPMGKTPESVKVFADKLRALGFETIPIGRNGKRMSTLDSDFAKLMLQPVKASDVYSWTQGEKGAVRDPQIISANKMTGIKNGLFDPGIFGDPDSEDPEERKRARNSWGRIELSHPLPNPIFMRTPAYNPYSLLTGVKVADTRALVEGDLGLVLRDRPEYDVTAGELVSVKRLDELETKAHEEGKEFKKGVDFKLGGEALEHLLSKVDVKPELAKVKEDLKTTKGTVRDKLYKKFRALQALDDGDMLATDLMLKSVPVLPATLRPIRALPNGSIVVPDSNYLYQALALSNKELAHNVGKKGDWLAPSQEQTEIKTLYKKLEQLYGTDPEKSNAGGKERVGIFAEFKGDGHTKEGIIRDRMAGKSLDYSGRSVITVNPKLSLDQAKIPVEMAKKLFKPQIYRMMINDMGVASNMAEAEVKWKKWDGDAQQALVRVVEDDKHPIILNRQPSLHKFSIQAFEPLINMDSRARSIELNPLIVKGFNADFDGDSSLNSVFMRVVEVEKSTQIIDVKSSLGHNKDVSNIFITKEIEDMPFSAETKIRYNYGVVNLAQFPRLELLSSKGNKENYSVPDNVEVLTVWNGVEQWLKVESFSVHKELKILEIKTNTSRTIQCSSDHSLVTVDEELNYKRWKAEDGMTIPRLRKPVKDDVEFMWELNLGDCGESKYTLKTNVAKLGYGFGYLNGVYIGDGWATTSQGRTTYPICLSSDTDDIPNFIKEIMADYFLEPLHICKVEHPHDFDGNESYTMKHTWYSKTFWNYLHHNIGQGAHDKHLPDFWMHSPESFRWGMLSGLIDTDGSIAHATHNTMINYTTVSRRLAYEIVAMSHTLNLTSSVTITQTPAGDPCYVVVFTQESVEIMRDRLVLQTKQKAERLAKFKPGKDYKRNKYTPKLNTARLQELRKLIGSPRVRNKQGEVIVSDEQMPLIKKRKSLYAVVYRVEKDNTALTRQTALDIFGLGLSVFEENSVFGADVFWLKYKAMVMDENIEWEMITDIKPLPFITEAYDLTIPPAYTMVTEAGFVIYDTMAVHIPLGPKAIAEARNQMMPSQNLVSPSNGSIVPRLQTEMALGLYYLTKDFSETPRAKGTYRNIAELRKAYESGELRANELTSLGSQSATVGQLVFNSYLPEKYRDYHREVSEKVMTRILTDIIADKGQGPTVAVRVLNDMKDLGFRASTASGLSIAISDFVVNKDKAKLIAAAQKKIDADPSKIYSAYIEVADAMQDAIKRGEVYGKDSDIPIMLNSGAKGSPMQFRDMAGMAGVGVDVTGKQHEAILSSHLDGLSPEEFYTHTFNARRGLADKVLSTAKPGYMSRQIWNNLQDVVVTMTDCGDHDGYREARNPSTQGLMPSEIIGRYLARPVAGVTVKDLIDQRIKDIIDKSTVNEIYIRSPISCKAPKGVCKKCYGVVPGTMALPGIGEPVGTLASHAIGEPITQMTMRTFHTGGAGVKGLPRIEELVRLSDKPQDPGFISDTTGTVHSIGSDDYNTTINILDGRGKQIAYKIPHTLNRVITVKSGDNVLAGDRLTEGDYSIKKLLKNRGLNDTQHYLVDELDKTFKGNGGGIDRKHTELTIAKLTSKVKLDDVGNHPDWVPGQIVDRNLVRTWNENEAKHPVSVQVSSPDKYVGSASATVLKMKNGMHILPHQTIAAHHVPQLTGKYKSIAVYPKPVTFSSELKGIRNNTYHGNDNWFSNLGYEDQKSTLARGGMFQQRDELDDSRSRTMSGKLLNIGSNFMDWAKEAKHSLLGFFG